MPGQRRPGSVNTMTKSPFMPGQLTITEKFSPYFCEFIGTFILTTVFGFAHAISGVSHGAYGVALVILIYSLGSVSGGIFNPAATLMLGFLGKISWFLCWVYIFIQFLGGLIASFTMMSLFGYTVELQSTPEYGVVTRAVGEIFYTTVLCFAVANCQYSLRNNPKNNPNQFYGIAIGFAVIAGGYAVGPISGGFFNPALAIGFGLAEGIAYVCFHVMGAAFAAALFRAMRPEDRGLNASIVADLFEPSWGSRMLSEFVGTLTVAFTFGCTVFTQASTGHGMQACATGSVLLCMTYSLSDVSGAHFNPAVSLAVWLSGRVKCRAGDMCYYVVFQTLAAIIASSLAACYHEAGPSSNRLFGVAPHAFHSWSQAGFLEVMFTFLICMAVLAVSTTALTYPGYAAPPNKNFYFAIAIAMSFTVGMYAVQTVSGGALNPAIALGMAIESLSEQAPNTAEIIAVAQNSSSGAIVQISVEEFIPDTSNVIAYWLFEFCGATLAAVLFHLTHAHEFYAKNEPADQS